MISFLTSFFRFFLQILLMKKEIVPHELEFLLRFPAVMNVTSPVDFLNNLCWGGIKVSSKNYLESTTIEGKQIKNTEKMSVCAMCHICVTAHILGSNQ